MVSDVAYGLLQRAFRWKVLILVLMEYGLGAYSDIRSYRHCDVLILVLMEYGLRLVTRLSSEMTWFRLNPCFNGIWSRTKPVDDFYGLGGTEAS